METIEVTEEFPPMISEVLAEYIRRKDIRQEKVVEETESLTERVSKELTEEYLAKLVFEEFAGYLAKQMSKELVEEYTGILTKRVSDKFKRMSEKLAGEFLAKRVSDELAKDYPKISPDIYEIERNLKYVIPTNFREVVKLFACNVEIKSFGHIKAYHPNKTITYPFLKDVSVPLVISVEYGKKKASIPIRSSDVSVEFNDYPYSVGGRKLSEFFKMNIDPRYPTNDLEYWKRYSKSNHNSPISVFLKEEPIRCSCGNVDIKLNWGSANGYDDFCGGEVFGKWTYDGGINECIISVPKVPESIAKLVDVAQKRYDEITKRTKETGNFYGQELGLPQFYILWIPLESEFKVTADTRQCTETHINLEGINLVEPETLKPRRIPAVNRDPALIMRVNNHYDHVVALWNDEKEIPLEKLIRKYTK